MPATLAVWPVALTPPQFIDGYGETPECDVAEVAPEVGTPIRRRRTSRVDDLVQVQGRYNSSQVTTILDFYETTIQSGALQFYMTHPRTKVQATFVMIDSPQVSCLDANIFDVRFNLRVMSG